MFKLDREFFEFLRFFGCLGLMVAILRIGLDAYPVRKRGTPQMDYIDDRLALFLVALLAIGAAYLIVRRYRIQKSQDEMRKLHGKDWG